MSICFVKTSKGSSLPLFFKTQIPNSIMHLQMRTSMSSSHEMGNILLVGFLAKTLSESGTQNLNPDSVPISENLVIEIMRKNSIETSKKIDFFKWCSFRRNYKHTACTYSHMIRTLCRSGHLDEVPSLLNSMKNDGVVIGSETFKVLLDGFIRQGKLDSAIDILGYMEEVGANVNTQIYDSVIVALCRKNWIGLATSIFFKLLEASNAFEEGSIDSGQLLPSAVSCNALLSALRKAEMRDEFKKVFDNLREKPGFEFDTRSYNICILAFGNWGDLGTSFKLFKELKEKRAVSGPDLCTYNSLIHVLCFAGKVKDALIIYEELKVSGHEPDAFTYRILIHGCSKSYRLNDAMEIFSQMQHNGFIPDTHVYNSLMNGMFKARKVKEACQLFERMVDDGVRASCWTYNIVIDGLFRNGRAEAGYTLFCDLKKKGQFVDVVTYSIVVLQLCKEGQVKEALRLVKEMEERGFVVDLITVTSLVIAFHKQGRWDWTERLMKHIRDSNLVPSILRWKADMEGSLNSPQGREKDYTPMFPAGEKLSEIMTLISSPVQENSDPHDIGANNMKSSKSDADQWSSSVHMDQLANEANSREHYTQLFSLARGQRVQDKGIESFDIDMVNTFLSIFLAKGKLSMACKLFEIFRDVGVNPVGYTYNSIMSSFVKKGYLNVAWNVLNEMGEKLFPADIATYNLIIQGLGKMGRADLASSILDKLMKQGGYLDIVMYNTLINILGKAGRIEEANKFFEQMKKSGINPDIVTYNTLIEVHSKAGRSKDAYKFLKMMLDAGCLPNHVTDTTLDNLAKEIEKSRTKNDPPSS